MRDQAIKRCIEEVSENVKTLREQRDKDPDNYDAMKKLRKEQTSVSIAVEFKEFKVCFK